VGSSPRCSSGRPFPAIVRQVGSSLGDPRNLGSRSSPGARRSATGGWSCAASAATDRGRQPSRLRRWISMRAIPAASARSPKRWVRRRTSWPWRKSNGSRWRCCARRSRASLSGAKILGRFEQDHRGIKGQCRPMLGFKSVPSATRYTKSSGTSFALDLVFANTLRFHSLHAPDSRRARYSGSCFNGKLRSPRMLLRAGSKADRASLMRSSSARSACARRAALDGHHQGERCVGQHLVSGGNC
jgi:hypothetical protein